MRGHRPERSLAHVQGQQPAVDPRGGQSLEELGREVQARGGRRHRAGPLRGRVHRLVVGAVGRVGHLEAGGPPRGEDVRRQRRAADAVQGRRRVGLAVHPDDPGLGVAVQQRDREAAVVRPGLAEVRRIQVHHHPVAEPPAPQQHPPAAGLEGLQEQPLDAATPAPLAPDEPGRVDGGVVQHQRVAPPQQLGQVADEAVLGRPPAAADDHEPRRVPRPGRLGGDPLGRQVVVEFVGAHGAERG
jgi:hypothetical protein